jgi:predicted DNA-binding transcriptional regulator AlpA
MTQQATESQSSRMLTVAEARGQIGVGASKFYELIREGAIEAVDLNRVQGEYARPGRPGKRRALRVSQAEIDRYLRDCKVSA